MRIIDERAQAANIGSNNEAVLATVAKLAVNTVTKLATDNSDILYSPSNVKELEENTTMLDNIVCLKIKNELVQN